MTAYEEKKPHEWKEDFLNTIDAMVATGSVTRDEADLLEDSFRGMYHYIVKHKSPAFNKYMQICNDFDKTIRLLEETGGISLLHYNILEDSFVAIADYVYNRKMVE